MKMIFRNILLLLIYLVTIEASEVNCSVSAMNKVSEYDKLAEHEYQRYTMIKKELSSGDLSYLYQDIKVKIINHGSMSDSDKAYIDYVFYKNNKLDGNCRFYQTDSFSDFGNAYLFKSFSNTSYMLIEYNGEYNTYFFIVEIANNKAVKKIYEHSYYYNRYTPEKLLKQDTYLPITYTIYEKGGGLYMKVGSTYKSDIITLKKPANVK